MAQNLPPSKMENGVTETMERPGTLALYMDSDGRRWTQRITAVAMEMIAKLIIAAQIDNRCHGLTTIRSKNRPKDNFAIAMPSTANVCPIISIYTAFAASFKDRLAIGWPNPCIPAILTKIAYKSRNTWITRLAP